VSFLKEAAQRVPVCVFRDVVMPGLSGLEILKRLAAKNFAAPIFLSEAAAVAANCSRWRAMAANSGKP
jgi:FixJ family two-component response regulator